MTERSSAQGCLLGLACGDALGRPVEFKSSDAINAEHGKVTSMLGHGTHGQPPGTITDDTEMALCIATSLVDSGGFDPTDVADRFAEWLESDPFDIGVLTRDGLAQIRDGASWDEAGVTVWESRPEGSNAGNGSVMRCAPYAIAFREFEAELAHVSWLSSAITHADPRCRWGCVILNRTLANLIRGRNAPLAYALQNTQSAPDELRSALEQVQRALRATRDDASFDPDMPTSGYVVDSLQAGLFFGLSAESVEGALVRAVNNGGDTDTIGAIAGAVAGARFGVSDIPDRWIDEIDESARLKRLAKQLLAIWIQIPGKEYVTLDDGSLVFKQRTIDGPAYISVGEFQRATIGHRPHPAPHRTIRREYHELTPASAAMLDWERRAYAVGNGRCDVYSGSKLLPGDDSASPLPKVVPVPQYPFAESFDDLPEQDQARVRRDMEAAAEAYVGAYTAFAGIRYPITELETEPIGIERMDPIAGATRVLVGVFGDAGEALLGNAQRGGYDSPADIEAAFETRMAGQGIGATAVNRTMRVFEPLISGASAILDYLTQFRLPQGHQSSSDTDPGKLLSDLRAEARTMVGELYGMYEALRRVALRHPEVDYEEWQAIAGESGGR
ncbi:ADP-ribosylglycohydrolase family protein [Halomicroarcula limicola]|uniref:ADP-ribosylglycohydrolase family protein n=1 Tax=Haloarcula limicola TaxID=1429915 RepID=A0A8J8C6H6_9EURY|nr:ADP-ribosylglycohydrolase family protein [Halomicroarcula limicola]MBV0926219.1 ADP-ribosylglycohydrolase family protein [Halomicroarcula limicola]